MTDRASTIRGTWRVALLSILAMAALPTPADSQVPADGLSGEQILLRYVAANDLRSEVAYVEMTVSAPGAATEERRLLAVYQRDDAGRNSYLLRLVLPEEVQGVSFLAIDAPDASSDQYIFLPTIGKARKLEPGNRGDAFLGSDFSYRDLVREIPDVHSYERLEDRSVRGKDCYAVRARDKDRDNAVYAHRDLFIAKDSLQLMRTDFFGKDGQAPEDVDHLRLRQVPVRRFTGTAATCRHADCRRRELYRLHGDRVPRRREGRRFDLHAEAAGSVDTRRGR